MEKKHKLNFFMSYIKLVSAVPELTSNLTGKSTLNPIQALTSGNTDITAQNSMKPTVVTNLNFFFTQRGSQLSIARQSFYASQQD